MKSVIRLCFVFLSISLILSCSKDEDENGTPSLSSFLGGNFNVTRADYTGTVSNSFGTIPVSGTGTETEGFFLFESFTKTTTYLLSTTMELSAGNQSTQYPIYAGGAGTFEVKNENSFTINDAVTGSRIYDITERTANSLRLSTDYQIDTLGVNADLVLSLYLSKD